ncbi:hypothetical protein KAR91_30600 [Candidatus Pacearchaeota archaeon]|nr:hypothetical protein [Candidatus Pacearchaeota archaeon]
MSINANIQETGGPLGFARLSKQIAGELLVKRNAAQAQATQNAYLKGQTILSKEFNRIENENPSDPDNLSVALKEYGDAFLAEINDPNMEARFGLQIEKSSQSAISRATGKRTKIINDEHIFNNLQVFGEIQSTLPGITSGMASGDPALAMASAEELQETSLRIEDMLNATDSEGQHLFSPQFRVKQLSDFKDASVVGYATGWLDQEPDKAAALRAIQNGELTMPLPDGQGGIERVNVQEALTPRAMNVVKAEAKRQVAQQKSDLLATQELPLQEQIKNQAGILGVIDNPKVSLTEKVKMINEMDLKGEIRDDFATEARRMLTSQRVAKTKIPDVVKFEQFNRLADGLGELRIKFGGTAEEVEVLTVDTQNMKAFQDYQKDVISELNKGTITEGEAKSFLGGVTGAVTEAIENQRTQGKGFSIAPGIQDVSGAGLDKINRYLKNQGRSDSIRERKALFMGFNDYLGHFDEKDNYVVTGKYESTGSTAQDERVVTQALKLARQSLNMNNFTGIIDDDNPPNQVVRSRPEIARENTFGTVEEMEAAGLPDGTPVMVDGVRGVVRK